MEGSNNQRKFRSPFKFSLSTSSLKPSPNPTKSDPSAASILRPRKLLSNDISKNRWSHSPIGSTQLPNDQAGSESKIHRLGRYETSSGVKYSAQPIIGRHHRENGVHHHEEERGRRIYDRPRSQVYPTSPLSLSPTDPLYDTPKTSNTQPASDTPTTAITSSGERESRCEGLPSPSGQSDKDLNQNYPAKVVEEEVKIVQERQLTASRSFGATDLGSRSVDRSVEGAGVGDGSVMSPVRPPRRSSSSSSAGRKPLTVVARESGETDAVKETGTKETKRERRLTRRISLEPKKVVSVLPSS